MKSVKFTEDELEFLRQLYQSEVEETEKYLRNIRAISDKLGLPKNPVEGNFLEIPIKTRKPRSDKGVKRGRRKKTAEEKNTDVRAEKSAAPAKNKPAKKKNPRRYSGKAKGVFLTPLRKPLVLKEPPETPGESTEKKD